MSEYKSLIRDLAKYALSKKGTELSETGDFPVVSVPEAQWGEFFEVSDKVDAARKICVPNDFMGLYATLPRLAEHQQRHPAIRQAPMYAERDGHIQIEVPFDAGIPLEFFHQLIDEAYDIAWNKLSPADRLKVDLAGLPYDEPKLIQ